MKHFAFAFVFCVLCLFTVKANTAELGVDFIFAGSMERLSGYKAEHGVSLRTHNTLFFRSNKMAQIGLVIQFEKPDDVGYELIAGAGLKFGFDYFLEADAGYLYRYFGNYGEKGLGLIVQFGKNFVLSENYNFKVSLPIVIKIVFSGLTKKTIFDYVPYLGFSYAF